MGVSVQPDSGSWPQGPFLSQVRPVYHHKSPKCGPGWRRLLSSRQSRGELLHLLFAALFWEEVTNCTGRDGIKP